MMRGCVRAGLLQVMAEEVELLCGPKHHPAPESDCRRAGSEQGQAYIEGQREKIIRPRVREKDGSEVRLASYQAASSKGRIFDEVVASLEQGLAARGAARAKGKGSLSKSEASRMWVERSREILSEFRSRSLAQKDWIALVIDGVFLHKDL
ncbi:IS256 family transposase, partial [Roseibacillus ishigakijimensis]